MGKIQEDILQRKGMYLKPPNEREYTVSLSA